MKFHRDQINANSPSYSFLTILSLVLIATATAIFIYFFMIGNFTLHYIIAVGCFWLLFCGALMGLIAYLMKTEKSVELTYEKTSKLVKRSGWLSLTAFYFGGICLLAGLICFAQKGDIWRNSIILFIGSILSSILCGYGLIQRKITKQHYELKKQQQEMIEILNERNMKDMREITAGTLLA